MEDHSPAFLQAREQVLNRLASSPAADVAPTASATEAAPAGKQAPAALLEQPPRTAVGEGASPLSAGPAPASPSDPATVKVPATVPVHAFPDKPKAAQNGSGSTRLEPPTPPMRGRPPEHQAQMRRMNALTNAVGVIPSLAQKPATVRAVLRLAAHFERWVASGVVPEEPQ